MHIADVLHHRNRVVHKIRSTDTVTTAVRKLSEHQIGALVVTDSWGQMTPALSVGELMSQDRITCQMKDRVHKALELMTTHRIRHLPVMESGAIIGIVSIGDLVGALIGDKELEVEVLRDMARAH